MPTGIDLGLRPWPLTHPRTGFRGRVMKLEGVRHLTKRRCVVPLFRSTLQILQLLERIWRSLKKEMMLQEIDVTGRGRRVRDPPRQTPWIIVVASAAERNRLKAPHHQTVSCLRRRQSIRSVTREVMTTDAPRGASQRLTLAPPNGRLRNRECS
jgi:hypothetical protein